MRRVIIAGLALCLAGGAWAGNRMLMGAGKLANPAAAQTLSFVGRGTIENASGTATLNYSTVVSGSAPVAGDLVIWCIGYQPEPASWSLPSGWTLLGSEVDAGVNEEHHCIAKIVAAGDIATPATGASGATYTGGLWVAFHPTQAATIGTPGYEDVTLTTGDPAAVNAVAAAVADPLVIVSVHKGLGLDGVPLDATWGATTGETTFTLTTDDGASEYLQTMKYKLYPEAGGNGENVTADQGDKGSSNFQAIMLVPIT